MTRIKITLISILIIAISFVATVYVITVLCPSVGCGDTDKVDVSSGLSSPQKPQKITDSHKSTDVYSVSDKSSYVFAESEGEKEVDIELVIDAFSLDDKDFSEKLKNTLRKLSSDMKTQGATVASVRIVSPQHQKEGPLLVYANLGDRGMISVYPHSSASKEALESGDTFALIASGDEIDPL